MDYNFQHCSKPWRAPRCHPLPPIKHRTRWSINLLTCVVLSTTRRCPARCYVARLVCDSLYFEPIWSPTKSGFEKPPTSFTQHLMVILWFCFLKGYSNKTCVLTNEFEPFQEFNGGKTTMSTQCPCHDLYVEMVHGGAGKEYGGTVPLVHSLGRSLP